MEIQPRILENAGQNMDALLEEFLYDPSGKGLAQAYADRHTIAGPTLSDMAA